MNKNTKKNLIVVAIIGAVICYFLPWWSWIILAVLVGLVIIVSNSSGDSDETDDFEALKAKAAGGDADAQFALGEHYETFKDFDEARKWYEKAAGQGYLDAMKHLIEFYMHLECDGGAENWADTYSETATEYKGYGYYRMALLAQENDDIEGAEIWAGRAVELGISEGWVKRLKEKGLI